MSAEIELHSVSKVHGSGGSAVRALDDVTLHVTAGERLSVIGPSGSGKSTLLHLIAALDEPTAGRIRVGGFDVGSMNEKQRSRLRLESIGFVFQSFHLFAGLTARENVAWPLDLARVDRRAAAVRTDRLLERLGLEARADHRPAELSGGEQQRVAIARALANDPAVLLADEPTGNLDEESGAIVLDLLEELHRERDLTLVIVTHDRDVASRGERCIEFRGGRVARDGRPDWSGGGSAAGAGARAHAPHLVPRGGASGTIPSLSDIR